MRYRKGTPLPLIIIGALGIFLVFFLLSLLFNGSPEDEAKRLVHTFYTFEQKADFGSSWELFHPLMKERFAKRDYIQQRNHVFMSHFGVDSFDYTVGEAKSVKSWKMAKDAPMLNGVYQVPITQTFKSTYGTFTLHQSIFVTKEDGKWRILWSYQ
ncbi:hypothetical protein LCL95_13510 [Bacillus timonensis]|nr:hypothetical protein [Bacillus timonensis]